MRKSGRHRRTLPPKKGAAPLLALALAMLSCGGAVHAQDVDEPKAIIELGAAGEWTAPDGRSSYGPSLAVETTPIEHWLEIEGGISPLFSRGQTEWDVDLLFKKPFTISDTAEFMAGIGPTWSHIVLHGRRDHAWGAEAALDFMFWPWKGRRLGWYVEPSWGYSFNAGHERALSASAGVLVPIP